MRVTDTTTTAQVLIRARTALTVEEFEFTVGTRRARITSVAGHWVFDGEWKLEFIHLEGPVIRQKDGGDSRIIMSKDTLPTGEQQLPVPLVSPLTATGGKAGPLPTPPEALNAVLATKPEWEPAVPVWPYTGAVLRGIKA